MKYFAFAFLSMLLLTSCGDSTSENKEPKAENKESEVPVKMRANAETAEGMLMMQHMIISFNEMQEQNKNYAVLIGELGYQCDYIIKNCSMTGEEHEELHKVLEPILASVQKAKNADTNEKVNAELMNIVKMTELFFVKFEADQAQV